MGAQVKKLVALVVIIAGLALPVATEAAATTATVPFATTITACNLNVQLNGSLLIISTTTSTPSGGFVSALHVQPQNVSGVDTATGTRYVGTGLTRDTFIALPSGGLIVTFVNEFHIQATAGAQSFVVSQLFHITITGDGSITAIVDNSFTSC